jgi:hypothetical protein
MCRIRSLDYSLRTTNGISVLNAVQNNKWIDHISPVRSATEIHEYVLLWNHVRRLQLDESSKDSIIWRWTVDGEYTTKSAYQVQFQGTFSRLKITPVWRAKAEAKCKFFAWTLLHKKILTANNLAKRQWPNDPICKLCNTEPETPTHLCKDCDFTKRAWAFLRQWLGLAVIDNIGPNGSLYNYWRRCRAKFDKTQRRSFDGVLIYFWWNIWKERNRRTFQSKSLQPKEVAFLCKEEIEQYQRATSIYTEQGNHQ